MGVFGLYTDEGVAQRMAGGDVSRHVVPATIDGFAAWAVVDSLDRDKEFSYDSYAPPGSRLTRKDAGGRAEPVEFAGLEVQR